MESLTPEETRHAKKLHTLLIVIAAVLVIAAFVSGWLIRASRSPMAHPPEDAGESTASEEDSIEYWTCSMHPQVNQPGPGLCPICQMDLIPVRKGTGNTIRSYSISPEAEALADIRVSPVERKFVTARIRLSGKIDYDETRVSYIASYFPGRIEKLFVDYTGIPVPKGHKLATLYSPEILATEQELLQAIGAAKKLEASDIKDIRDAAWRTVEAVREKMRLWGLTEKQIEDVEDRGKPADTITINSPMDGIVIDKNAVEGMYVQTGTRIYTIADLTTVWVKLDAYESDLMWLRYRQEVIFTTQAYPGETFKGTIAFIDPVVDSRTRTVKVRVNVPNKDGRLKPEMFVKAVVDSTIAKGANVVVSAISGKWVCPMHPEVIENEPGDCPICDMPLVSSEEMDAATVTADDAERPLVIPATAPLITGKRAIVYVKLPNDAGTQSPLDSVFEGREINLGPRAGDYYVVMDGLTEGEQVVTNGAFKIDSALQLQAKPSMMQPSEDGETASGKTADAKTPAPMAFQKSLAAVYGAYEKVQAALADDDIETAKGASAEMAQILKKVDMSLLDHEAHRKWMAILGTLDEAVENLAAVEDIQKGREEFELISNEMENAIRTFGVGDTGAIYKVHCPMAFDNRGADWLQSSKDVRNPFFGSMMLECGEVVDTIVEE